MGDKLTIISFYLFNFLVSLTAITFFYYEYQLPAYWIIIHQIVTLYSITVFYYLCLVIVKYLSRSLSYILITFLMILFQFGFLFLHITYYIGKANWGHPLTINLFKIYFKEINYLIESLFITPTLFYVIFLIILLIIIVPILAFSKKIWKHFKNRKIVLNTKQNIFIGSFLFILIPILFFTIDKINTSLKRTDPLISFFLYEWEAQDEKVTHIGEENNNEKKQYPTNLKFNKKNVILIICDALRSDYIYSNGYNRKISPFIDSISTARNTIKLNNFYSISSRSFSGISSILSSNFFVSYKNFFIHDVLKKQGYNTKFLLSGDHTHHYGLKKHFGNNIDLYYDGFDAVKNNISTSVNNDDEVVINKLKKISKFKNTPTFFYLHYMSTHQVGILNNNYKRNKSDFNNLLSKKISKEVLINDYDNRVKQLDDYLKKSIKILKDKGYLENSIIVITSDHGQALGEKGYNWHVNSTYLGEISIPLIFIESDKTNHHAVKKNALYNQLDISPTITDLLNIPTPKNWQGTSIFKEKKNAFIFQQEREFYSCIWIENEIRYQYIFNIKTKREELYNITTDTKQQKNLISLLKEEKLNNLKEQMKSFFSIIIE